MSISSRTHKMLWGRAGNRCAVPDCRIELVMDASETDDESLIGEECHIIARRPDGPRGDASYPEDKINRYENLILICRNHHKLIDDQFATYPVAKLREMKSVHEKWVRESLAGFDFQRQKDEEIYASYADKWIELADVNNWKGWSSFVLGGGRPEILEDVDKNLKRLQDWLFSRIWPSRYTELECAFENFRRVLQDFQNLFHEYAEKSADMLRTRKFYQIDEWDKEKYKELHIKYIFHVDLVQDLMLELTRAGNYICDKLREYINPVFRMNEGLLIVVSGPYMDFSWHHHRVAYQSDERIRIPYPGIEEFKKTRENRDNSFGLGVSDTDPRFIEWLARQ